MRRGLGLWDNSLRGSLACAFRVTFGRNWKSCKSELHPRHLFVFSRILGNSRGLSGIRGHHLCFLGHFLIHPKLLYYFWRTARRGEDLAGVAFLRICHLKRGIWIGDAWGRGTNGWGVVDTFCLLQHRRSLNRSLVEGFIPHLGTIKSTYPWDVSPKGVLGLGHPNIIFMLLCLLPNFLCFLFGLFSVILSLLNLIQLLLQSKYLFPRGGQLVLDIAEQHPLAFCLPLSTFQDSGITFFFSLSSSVNLALRSLVLFSATWKASTAAICLPSSSLYIRWELPTISSALKIAWMAWEGKEVKKKKKKKKTYHG